MSKIDYFALEKVAKKLPNPNEYGCDFFMVPLFKNEDFIFLENSESYLPEDDFINVLFEKRFAKNSDGEFYVKWYCPEYRFMVDSNPASSE